MSVDLGLRERKKRRTREQIVEAAMGLFAENGYDGTTIADIAAAADIAPRTFFAYFPSKEAVVFHDSEDEIEHLRTVLTERPEGELAFTTLRRWIEARFAEEATGEHHADGKLRKQLCSQSEELQRTQHAVLARFEGILREAVARDLGDAPDDLRPQLVAGATIGAIRGLEPAADADEEHTPEEAKRVLDQLLLFLEGGLGAMQRGSAA